MFGFNKKKPIENHMAEWLAHPNEFGQPPKSVKFKRTYKATLMGHGKTDIHLVDYEMPDGVVGRGFVNGSLTWSFLGEGVNAIDEQSLLTAYCGWAWLFPSIQAGNVLTDFQSEQEEALFVDTMQKKGVEGLQIQSRYKIGTSELFEFRGTMNGEEVRGAGDSEYQTGFKKSDPEYALPSIYFHLGEEVIESMA